MNFRPDYVAAVLLALVPHSAGAADARSGVFDNAVVLDDDFFLQGEYSGTLPWGDGRSAGTGLQVVALGAGKFQAVEYSGGLPGSGWDGKSRRKYSGGLVAPGIAELSGDGRRLTIRRRWAVIQDARGKSLGRLEKTVRLSQTLRAAPPAGARVLFNGFDARQFAKGVVTADHLLVAGADTKQPYGDFVLHLEFRTPYLPAARGQGRGNSGVYIQQRYEVQVLDSFGLDGADNECGSLYKQRAPLLNMAFPPLSWQTYDVDFTAPRFDSAGNKTRNARITVKHNGVIVQNDVEMTAKTGGGAPEGASPRPLRLQDHGNPVHFRNIWIIEKLRTAESRIPVVELSDSVDEGSPGARIFGTSSAVSPFTSDQAVRWPGQ
jgi:hypothetical protein